MSAISLAATSAITDAAEAALVAERAAAVIADAAACEALTVAAVAGMSTTLTPLAVAGLTVAHIDLGEGLVVFTDGTLSLAWTTAGVAVVVADDDGWTYLAAVTSLAAVGEWLEA